MPTASSAPGPTREKRSPDERAELADAVVLSGIDRVPRGIHRGGPASALDGTLALSPGVERSATFYREPLGKDFMVLVRCQEHYPDPNRTKRNYVVAVEPVGYPDTAAVCGRERRGHAPAGYVLLHEAEYEHFKAGQRVFDPNTASVDIRVTDNVVEEL